MLLKVSVHVYVLESACCVDVCVRVCLGVLMCVLFNIYVCSFFIVMCMRRL